MASVSSNSFNVSASTTTQVQPGHYITLPQFPHQSAITTAAAQDLAQNHSANDGQMYQNLEQGHYTQLPQFQGKYDYDGGYASFPDSKSYVDNYKPPEAQKASGSTSPPQTLKRFRSTSKKVSGIFNSKIRRTEAKNVEQSAQLEAISGTSGKEKTGKLKENAQVIGKVIKRALKDKDKKAELKRNGSIELELAGIGKVTVLKSERKNPLHKGNLYVRFNGQAHLGSGAFKDVELGIKLKSFNRAIPIAIAKAKVQSDTSVLKTEHETSQKMRSLFGDTIFASKRMVNLGNGEQGFVMPLSHGNYRSPKAKTANGKVDIPNRPGMTKLPKEKKVQNAKVMLETLRKMEAAGYVHGDFKEDNIFLDAGGNAQLADWGAFYTRDDFQPENVKARKAQIENDLRIAQNNGESDKVKGLQVELSNMDSNFDALTRLAKFNWAMAVFDSFSAAEWAEVKDQVISIFGDDPKLNWTDNGPEKIIQKRKQG